MTEKTLILSALGEEKLLLPSLVNAAQDSGMEGGVYHLGLGRITLASSKALRDCWPKWHAGRRGWRVRNENLSAP